MGVCRGGGLYSCGARRLRRPPVEVVGAFEGKGRRSGARFGVWGAAGRQRRAAPLRPGTGPLQGGRRTKAHSALRLLLLSIGAEAHAGAARRKRPPATHLPHVRRLDVHHAPCNPPQPNPMRAALQCNAIAAATQRPRTCRTCDAFTSITCMCHPTPGQAPCAPYAKQLLRSNKPTQSAAAPAGRATP